MKACSLLSLLVLVLLPLFSAAAEPVRISFDQANFPFMYGKNGKAMGVYPALVEAAFKRMQVTARFQVRPWARVLLEIEDGIAGVGGLYKSAERERKYDFSEPLLTEVIMVYYNKAKPVACSRGDLKGLRVGVVRGWSYGNEFDAARRAGNFTVEETVADKHNFQKLALGRLDVVVAPIETGKLELPQFSNLAMCSVPLAQNPTFLAFAKTAGKTVLLRHFNKTIKEMKTSGEFDGIVAAEMTAAGVH